MTMLYRGVRVELGVDLALAQAGTTLETVGQELQLGPKVIDALSSSGGLGTHWSTRPEIAERFALESSGNGGGTPVLVTVNWDGSGEDKERTNTGGTWADEAEVTILPGTALQVVSVKLGSGFADGVEVLHSDRYLDYASDFAAAGLPVPQGGPQQRTASSDIVVRGFRYDEVSFELGQKYMNGTMTGRDILQDIEKTYGSVGVWWGTVGSSADDFYGSPEDARNYAGWSGDGSIEHRWQDMLGLTGGVPDPSEWMDAEIRVVLVAKKPMRDYGTWNPTTENGEGSMWESTSFFAEGEQLELTEVHYAADRSGNDWKVERVSGLTVTAQGYFMDHRPAGPDYGAPMHDVTEMFSDYFYEDPYSFDHGEDGAREAIQKMIAAKGNPSARVTIYRAVPEGSGGSIRTGDWVTISKAYATQHGYGLDSSQIISASVQASDLWTEGNSVCEWGYHGPELRTAGTEYAPGPVYRGINTDMLTDDELDEIEEWAAANAYSQNNYQLAEPNYGLIHRIVDRLERNGLGRHWSKDYDVSAGFAQDQGDNIAIIFIGDWDGQGVDDREFHRGWDGVQRPSNVEHEKEVTLMPGSRVTLVGVDVVMPTGFTSNIPVPTIQVTASRTAAEPGGVLPWVPSDNGYYWITKNDDSMEAVTNDGINRMRLYEKPWGWEWVVRDSQGVVEKGNFGSGMASDALRDRADDLLSEFDTNPLRRTRGPSRDYQDDYTQAPNELWGRRKTTSQRYAERLRREGRR